MKFKKKIQEAGNGKAFKANRPQGQWLSLPLKASLLFPDALDHMVQRVFWWCGHLKKWAIHDTSKNSDPTLLVERPLPPALRFNPMPWPCSRAEFSASPKPRDALRKCDSYLKKWISSLLPFHDLLLWCIEVWHPVFLLGFGDGQITWTL